MTLVILIFCIRFEICRKYHILYIVLQLLSKGDNNQLLYVKEKFHKNNVAKVAQPKFIQRRSILVSS